MEKTFAFIKENKIQGNSNDYHYFKEDIHKLMDIGLVLKQSGWYKVNPLIESKKSVTEARNALKKKVQGWMDTMQHIDDVQLKFRYDMVEFFKENPIVNNTMPGNTPLEYLNGKGYLYIMNGEIITLHLGYKPPHNSPTNCDRFKYSSINGMIQIEG